MWILTLLLFVFILSLIILVHELGHFMWAKKCGVHIYEFDWGMIYSDDAQKSYKCILEADFKKLEEFICFCIDKIFFILYNS